MKRQHKSMLSSFRPQIHRILEVEDCLKCFKEFCKVTLTSESLDCILEVNHYLKSQEADNRVSEYTKLKEIYETYLLDSSPKTVNVSAAMKKEILQHCYNESPNESFSKLQVNQALKEIRDELIGTLGWRIPHFIQSSYWHEFSINNQPLVTLCLNEIDKQTWKKIRYRREDFIRDRFSEKEVMLCEFMKDDHSLFKLQKSDLNGCLSVYTCDGKDILDEDDIGMGKFQGFKVAGSLPYPAWLIMMALASTKFHADIWQGFKFDREYDFRYIPSSEENGQLFYDTHIAKLVVRYGKLLENRSTYCMTENLYKGNKTYMINKSITPHDGKYASNYFENDINTDIVGEYETHDTNLIDVNPIINMKGRKKCVHMPVIALFAIQPFGDNQSLFSYSNLTNPGGMLLSKLGTPQKRVLDIASNYRENVLIGIQKLLENDGYLVKRMKNVYETVQTRLNRFKIASKSTESHIFEPSFEDQLAKLFLK